MRHKRGILGTIFLAIILALFLVGLFMYFQIRTKGIEFATGNFIFNIKYKDQEQLSPDDEQNINNVTIQEIPENETEENVTEDDLNFQLNNYSMQNEELIIETNKS